MVKTKLVAKKQTEKETKKKKIIQENLFESKKAKKGEYRTKDQPFGGMGEDEGVDPKPLKDGLNNGWWQSMQDGETCRTADEKKVHALIGISLQQNKGINIQGIPEDRGYFWYMTRIMTEVETKKPGSRIKGK